MPPNYPGPHSHPINTVKRGDPNPFSAALDFSFKTYATPGLAKIVYILFIAVTIMGYLWSGLSLFALVSLGGNKNIFEVLIPGLFAMVLGLIPAALVILGVRLALEQALATVRTAMDTRAIAEALEKKS